MRCHIKVKNKTLKHCSIKTPSLVKFNFNIHVYMNDDGRSPIIVTKSHLTPHNGRPVYVTSEKKNSENYSLVIEHYPVIVYFDIDISYT